MIIVLGLYIVYFLLLIHSIVNVGEVEPDDPDF